MYWYSEQWAEQRLQEYIERLEDSGFTTRKCSLADFQVDVVVEYIILAISIVTRNKKI